MPRSTARLRVVKGEDREVVHGSAAFLRLTRNPALPSPRKFEPTPKAPGDIII